MSIPPLIKEAKLFLDDKPSVYAIRSKAKKTLLKNGFPTIKTENWKYTDITPILKTNFSLNDQKLECNCCKCNSDNNDSHFINITFCHGQLHIEEYNLPSGISITPLPMVLYDREYKKYICQNYDITHHAFAALNEMYIEQGVCIHIDKNTQINTPIFIKYNNDKCDTLQNHIHNLIILEANSSIEIAEKYYSDNKNTYFTNIVNEIYLKENSSLNHYKIQKESPQAYHISLNAVKVKNNATYKQYYSANGAKICRQETLVNLDDTNANAEIYSAYTTKKDCINDITTNINHLYQHTTSNQYAKAILEEGASASFQGKIHIAKNATKTSGKQLHKSLYISDNATINCKPELEIFADDVKCSHGASCGELDKNQLFYLTSRGIEKDTAIKMLTEAHLQEIINIFPNDKIKNLL